MKGLWIATRRSSQGGTDTASGNSSPVPVPGVGALYTWKMTSPFCLWPALLKRQFLPFLWSMKHENPSALAFSRHWQHKHCQIPSAWHGALSRNTGIKTSVLYVSNWLLPLKIQFCTVLDKIIPWVGISALFVGVHNFLWSPLFVSIMLPTRMAVKQF